ncbi:MAG: Class II abasic (AP) endonuclease [Trizodia sp. TS-e1964]|nr:MAG: Class II abasic (AP) endonuclease [Trizodia sp. TS-e1964]
MFELLEADIIIFQELKIQRKDLRDDDVLIPGWDCYFSLPKLNRGRQGYSGVAIFTRQEVCSPLRAEEGITGVLNSPKTSQRYIDLPEDQQIGGYPTPSQLSRYGVDAAALDAEGRCVILEFPAFVIIGLYSPANRDDSRDEFRLGYINAWDSRIRNLIAEGKRVILAGDLNISRDKVDMANAEESTQNPDLESSSFVASPSRRILNQLLIGGRVLGERDEGRENAVMWDICRGFHESRKGMFTHWEQKINARPGNFGSRLDYVLCSHDTRPWFCESNIQEGLIGSDHCPVYAVIKDRVSFQGTETEILDIMNREGAFRNGKRLRSYSIKHDTCPLSGRLMSEFDRRRNIRDMFLTNSASTIQSQGSGVGKGGDPAQGKWPDENAFADPVEESLTRPPLDATAPINLSKRPLAKPAKLISTKRSKTSPSTNKSCKGQKTLKTFFPLSTPQAKLKSQPENLFSRSLEFDKCTKPDTDGLAFVSASPLPSPKTDLNTGIEREPSKIKESRRLVSEIPLIANLEDENEDAIKSSEGHAMECFGQDKTMETWAKLFTPMLAPRCDGHGEDCIQLTTKKKGINCGRGFWICSR